MIVHSCNLSAGTQDPWALLLKSASLRGESQASERPISKSRRTAPERWRMRKVLKDVLWHPQFIPEGAHFPTSSMYLGRLVLFME